MDLGLWDAKACSLFRLLKLLEESTKGSDPKILIFVETKRKADELTRWMRRDGWPTLCIHGDKAQNERDFVLNGKWMFGSLVGYGCGYPGYRSILGTCDYPGFPSGIPGTHRNPGFQVPMGTCGYPEGVLGPLQYRTMYAKKVLLFQNSVKANLRS